MNNSTFVSPVACNVSSVTTDMVNMIRTYVNCTVCLLGFIANIVAVPVLVRQLKMQKCSSFKYLCALTTADILCLGFGITESIPRLFQLFDETNYYPTNASFNRMLGYGRLICVYTSRFIIIIISSERLLAVVRPFNVKNSVLAKFPIRIVIGCAIFNSLFCLPFVICDKAVHCQDSNFSITVGRKGLSLAIPCDSFIEDFIATETIIHNVLPTILLIIINSLIPIQFYRSSSEIKIFQNQSVNGNANANHQWKITINVVVISVIYMLLSIPATVSKLHYLYAAPESHMYKTGDFTLDVLHRFLVTFAYVNAASDFLVFYVVSSKYRSTFQAIYCRH